MRKIECAPRYVSLLVRTILHLHPLAVNDAAKYFESRLDQSILRAVISHIKKIPQKRRKEEKKRREEEKKRKIFPRKFAQANLCCRYPVPSFKLRNNRQQANNLNFFVQNPML